MAKETNGTWKKIGVIAGIVVVLLSAAVAYGMLCGRVNEHDNAICNIKPRVSELEKGRERVEARQEMMLDTLKRIEGKLDDTR